MAGWERLYTLITDDIQMSSIIAVSLLVIGYVCSLTSKNCVYSYHIGRNRDAAAGRFAMISAVLYLTAMLTLGTVGHHVIKHREMLSSGMPRITNSTRIEVRNPLTDWFNELYGSFKDEISMYGQK